MIAAGVGVGARPGELLAPGASQSRRPYRAHRGPLGGDSSRQCPQEGEYLFSYGSAKCTRRSYLSDFSARLIGATYERRSVALSSNLHPSALDQIMEKSLSTALVDRLMHHAHVVVTEGSSVRLSDATSGKGVVVALGS